MRGEIRLAQELTRRTCSTLDVSRWITDGLRSAQTSHLLKSEDDNLEEPDVFGSAYVKLDQRDDKGQQWTTRTGESS